MDNLHQNHDDANSTIFVVVWRSGIRLDQRSYPTLVLGWVTVSGSNSRCGTFISECNEPPESTQPGHPFVGRRNE